MPKMTEILKKGQVESRHTDNALAQRWMDRREVYMLTTLYTGTMRQTGKTDRKTNTPTVKPDCVIDYNKNMGAVDRSDMISSAECVRKCFKWYK
jgi:hypothetical protein